MQFSDCELPTIAHGTYSEDKFTHGATLSISCVGAVKKGDINYTYSL